MLLMTYLAEISKVYQYSGASEVGNVNVYYVCKWAISCKSMYLTLDFSLIANLPSKTNEQSLLYLYMNAAPYHFSIFSFFF